MSKALIFWVNSDETSIVPIIAVTDKRMLTDDQRCGKVKWMGESDDKKKPPKDGWSKHDGRVLLVNDKKSKLLEKEEEFWVTRKKTSCGERTAGRNFDEDKDECVANGEPLSKKQRLQKEKSAAVAVNQSILSEVADNLNRIEKEKSAAVAVNQSILSGVANNFYRIETDTSDAVLSELANNANRIETGAVEKGKDESSGSLGRLNVIKPWLAPPTSKNFTSSDVSDCNERESLQQQVEKYREECVKLKRERDDAVSALMRMQTTVTKLKEDLPNIFEYLSQTLAEAGGQKLPAKVMPAMSLKPVAKPQLHTHVDSQDIIERHVSTFEKSNEMTLPKVNILKSNISSKLSRPIVSPIVSQMTIPRGSSVTSSTPPCRETTSSVLDDVVRTPKSGASCEMPCGVDYELTAYVADNVDDKIHKRNSVVLAIRKLTYAPEEPAPQPTAEAIKEFIMSPGSLRLEASLDKEKYYHGESIAINILVDNITNKHVKKVKISVIQIADIMLFSKATYKCTVAELESEDGFPILPSQTGFCKVYYLTPLLSNNKDKRGLALDGKIKHEDTNLASSAIIRDQTEQENLGILVQYRVRVRLSLGFGSSDLSVELPFTLTHSKPPEEMMTSMVHRSRDVTTDAASAAAALKQERGDDSSAPVDPNLILIETHGDGYYANQEDDFIFEDFARLRLKNYSNIDETEA